MSTGSIRDLKIRRTLEMIVSLLASNNFKQLETISHGVRLGAEHIQAACEDYGRTITVPPSEAFRLVDVVEIDGQQHPEYSIRFRLFTEEEGRSDLELQATFIDSDAAKETMSVEIDDVIVA